MPRILIIEDNIQFADLVAQYLKRRGLDSDTAPDGVSGLRSFINETYDLLLVDARLPLLSGEELCRRVRETPKGREVPLLMMSGYLKDLSEIEKLKRELGLIGFLAKPFSSETLHALIVSALQGRASAPPPTAAAPASIPTPAPAAATTGKQQTIREDLARTPFELVLLYLLKNRATGTLTVARGATRRSFYFIDGAPVELELPDGDEDFGTYLRHKNRIDAGELREYTERKKTDTDPRDLFVKMGCLTPREFRDQTEEFLRDHLIDCFSWRNGTVVFEWGRSLVKSFPTASVLLPSIFYNGFKAHLSPARISAFLEKKGSLYPERTPAFYDIQNHLAAEIAEPAVLDLINGSRTSSEIANAMIGDDDAVVLFTLDYLRVLSYSETPRPSDTPPPFPLRQRSAPAHKVQDEERFEDLGGELSAIAGDIDGLGESAMAPAAAAEGQAGLAALEEGLRNLWEAVKEKNYYELFGMTRQTFSMDKLKKAYFDITKTYGPEKFFASSSEVMALAEELLSKASNAYNTLTNVVSKENYDELLMSQMPVGAEERKFFEKVQFQSGKVLLEQGQYDSAEKAFSDCLAITPDKPEYLVYLAVAIYHNPASKGNPALLKRAKDLVNKSLVGEKLSIAYALKGTMLFDEGHLNLAEAEFNKSLKLNPGNKTALKQLELIRQRREEEKKGFFQKMFR